MNWQRLAIPALTRLPPFQPLPPTPHRATVITALSVSHLALRISFLTLNLCAIAAWPVQLKAVVENWALYMVFYYLTHPAIRR